MNKASDTGSLSHSSNFIFINADFIQQANLRADQITFVDTIISYLTKNGMIEKKMLFEPPFTNMHDQGLLGVFDDADASKVIQLIDRVNDNALVKAFVI